MEEERGGEREEMTDVKQEGKKKYFIFGSVVIFLTGILVCGGFNLMNNNKDQLRTETAPILELFPKLESIKACKWEIEQLGTKGESRVPGPSTYCIRGIIELEKEKYDIYSKEYEWIEIDINSDSLDKQDFLKGHTWLSSNMFEEEMKPMYVIGHIYLCKDESKLYFDVCK